MITNEQQWNNQVQSIRYRYLDGHLAGVRHIPGKDGKPLCAVHIGGSGSTSGGVWEYVPRLATCQLCKKRSRSG